MKQGVCHLAKEVLEARKVVCGRVEAGLDVGREVLVVGNVPALLVGEEASDATGDPLAQLVTSFESVWVARWASCGREADKGADEGW